MVTPSTGNAVAGSVCVETDWQRLSICRRSRRNLWQLGALVQAYLLLVPLLKDSRILPAG